MEPAPELALVLPVYNEEACIASVVESWRNELSRLGIAYVMTIINDGSTDRTGDILQGFASDPRIEIVTQPNSGHGAALLDGYSRAVARAPWIFQTDSDDEMNPADFAALWECRHGHEAVFGVRQRAKRSAVRRLITGVSRGVVKLLFGSAVHDVNVPFRLIRARTLAAILPLVPRGTFAPNVMIAGAIARWRLATSNRPLRNRPRQTGISFRREVPVLLGAVRAVWEVIRFSVKLRSNKVPSAVSSR